MLNDINSLTLSIGVFFLITAPGCVSQRGTVVSGTSDLLAFDEVIQIEKDAYSAVGKEKTFSAVRTEYYILLSKCREGTIVEHVPRKYVGLDGGFFSFIPAGTRKLEDIFEPPTHCIEYYREKN
jgi:hypothetical protein